jgi:DNA-binding NarL/FixJ family response regulator
MKTALILEDIVDSQVWLTTILQRAFPGIELQVVDSLTEAKQWLTTHSAPDLALIDLGLPDGSGIEFIVELNYKSPKTLCIVASIFDDNDHIFPALRAGARGYLLKDQPLAKIVELLQGIAEGHPPISPAIARKMLGYFQPEPAHEMLTEREIEVLRCIAKGLTLAETGKMLTLSPHTISGYVKDIYRKLNVCSRAEAALSARNLGLV